jgi:hypothetical protein
MEILEAYLIDAVPIEEAIEDSLIALETSYEPTAMVLLRI